MLADFTQRVSQGELSREEVAQAMAALLDAAVPNDAKAAFLRAWALRGETASELAACAGTLLPRASDPGVRGSFQGKPLLDCCGTGGGGLNLLNVSTGIVFILAAMGIPVVKHGNRGLTKKSGSADVLEALGIRIDLPPEKLEASLEEVGAAFLFAPAYHTSFSVLAPVRQQLGAEGRRTVFNLLGPLLNPARPDARLVGVFQTEHVGLYREALHKMGCPRFTVACGIDDPTDIKVGEVSANGMTLVGGNVRELIPAAAKENFIIESSRTYTVDSMQVADARQSAENLTLLLNGKKTELGRDMLIINAAAAACTHGAVASLEEGKEKAAEALDSKRALEVLKTWKKFSSA